jgi:hypothetical protein
VTTDSEIVIVPKHNKHYNWNLLFCSKYGGSTTGISSSALNMEAACPSELV